MKFATQILMLAASAGLAALAITTRKPADEDAEQVRTRPPAHAAVESEAWFV